MSSSPRPPGNVPDDASLDQQIRRVEQRLMRHRAASASHLARFRSQVRDYMSSPLLLLLASGIGFAIGSSQGTGPAPSSADAPRRYDEGRFLSTMVTMVSLTGSVMTLWQRFRRATPSVSRPDKRSTQSNSQTPSQAATPSGAHAQENTPA